MQLRQLEMFSVLAQERHFGRAAARLQVSQPALSQQLQHLEAELGVQLVVRTSREVTLTEAGSLLLDPALEAIASVSRAATLIGDFRAGHAGRVVIGSLGAGLNGPLPAIIRRFHATNPHTVVELYHQRDNSAHERALRAGEIDAAFVRRIANDRAVESVQVLDEGFVVALPEDHRFAGRSQLSLSELSGETFAFWPRRLGSGFYDLIVDACRTQGFEPDVRSVGDTLEAQLALVAAGLGVSVQAQSNASVGRPGVVFVPLRPDDLRAALWCAFRRGKRSASADAFLEAVRAHISAR